MKWINCARHVKEQNTVHRFCHDKVYYMTSRDIHPGEELLVYYGDTYAQYLEIDVDNYYNMTVDIDAYKHLGCWNII